MIVKDCFKVVGKGWIVVADGDKLSNTDVLCGETIVKEDNVFTISGVGRIKYDDGWFGKSVELILAPNDIVPDCFEIGDEIEIMPSKE